jgi:RNA polymerase sigma-70 factor (ECF subfamily)
MNAEIKLREDPDAGLVREFASGGEAAFEQLFARLSPRVLAVATRIVGNRHDAMDVLQEVFVKVHHRIGQFRHQSTFALWVLRIAVNESLNWATRKMSKERPLGVAEPAASPNPDFEDTRALEILRTLPDKLRVVAVLRYQQGLSYQEITDVLGCSPGTMKSRLFAANRIIREALQRLRAAPRSDE